MSLNDLWEINFYHAFRTGISKRLSKLYLFSESANFHDNYIWSRKHSTEVMQHFITFPPI